ncbi:MAG: hypothetical protein ACI80L_002623, partial [Pseudohongiellaceae bacterium]
GLNLRVFWRSHVSALASSGRQRFLFDLMVMLAFLTIFP